MFKRIAPFLFFVFIFSCGTMSMTSDSNEDEAMIQVDLEDYLDHPHKNKVTLSGLLDTLIYIPLKSPESLPVGTLTNVKITDSYVGCSDKENNLFLFTREGDFISKIGSMGQGPKEYVVIADFSISEKDETVSIYDIMRRKIQVYDIKGEFIKSLSYPEKISTLLQWKDSVYVGYMPWYEDRERIAFFNSEMNQTDSYYPERNIGETSEIDLFPLSELRTTGSTIHFRLPLDNCDYIMGSEAAVIKNTEILLGKYQAPVDVETNVSKFNENINGPYALGLKWIETNGTVFIQYLNQMAYHRLVYNSQDKNIYFVDEGKYPSGIDNEDNESYSFWPSWTDGEYAIGFIDADAVEGEWKQYDNPVLMLGRVKK